MQKIVIANLKMNLSKKEIISYLDKINKLKEDNFIVCVPSIFLHLNNEYKNAKIGSQNFYYDDKGSYTGEISPLYLKEEGIKYSLVGHYERREYFNENFNVINKKVISGLKNNIKLIVCIDSLSKTFIKYEIHSIFKNVKKEDLKNVLIAYEPSYMIGSGKKVNYEQVNNNVNYIKSIFKKDYNIDVKVLYGGSVDENNIEKIYNKTNIDGVLVGKSALDYEKIMKIIKMSN